MPLSADHIYLALGLQMGGPFSLLMTSFCCWLRGLSSGRNCRPLIPAIPRRFYQVGVSGQTFFVESQKAVGLFLRDGAFLHAVDEESRHPSRQFVGAELDK